ncbi:MAG: outer membrane beta-barrel protein [Cyclobacteriaceae bacterium]
MRYLLYFTFALLLLNQSVEAQRYTGLMGLSWNVSVPLGQSTNFVGETSLRGGQFEFRDFLNSNLSLGGSLGWNGYQEYEPRETYPIDNGAITTDLTKFVYTLPVLFNVHRYFPVSENVLPYIGAGIGAKYSRHAIYYSIYTTEENKWGFAVRPEIGVIFPINDVGIILAADYLWATNDSSILNFGNTSSLNFRLGMVLLR